MTLSSKFYDKPIPAKAGIGLRSSHYSALYDTMPDIGWLEAHSENYFGKGGRPLEFLEHFRENYPLSLHGVGLGIGSADELSAQHLKNIKQLTQRFQPALLSEHLCWNAYKGNYLNDLLPLPYTEEALTHVVSRVSEVQDYLGRQILIENLSSYLEYDFSTISEWEFLAELSNRSGCGILLDINNIYISSVNHDFDPHTYINAIPMDCVHEIHLAGFEESDGILVDTHSRAICDEVWNLYKATLKIKGPCPTLIEWDQDIPELSVLLAEADKADALLTTVLSNASAA